MNTKTILTSIAKPFIGSGISRRFPWLQTLYRMLFSQTKNTIITVPIGKNISFSVPDDTGPGLFLATSGTYEPYTTKLFLAALRPDDIVFDIGAHAGYYSLLAASALGKKGHIHAFEPMAITFALLKKNLATNKFSDRCTCYPVAVDKSNGTKQLFISSSSSGEHTLVDNTGHNSVPVTCITIDSFTTAQHIYPTIIKLDIEGAEHRAFNGMKKTLKHKKLRTIFFEVNANNSEAIETIHLVQQSGFTIRVIDENTKKLKTYSDEVVSHYLHTYGYVNIQASR